MRWGVAYGEGDSMPYAFQIFLYTHLYTYFFYVRFIDEGNPVRAVSCWSHAGGAAAAAPPDRDASGMLLVAKAILPFVFALMVGGKATVRWRPC